MSFIRNDAIDHGGQRYWFAWTCGYRGSTDYSVREPDGTTFRAELRHSLDPEWRATLNYKTEAEKVMWLDNSIGLLVRRDGVDNGLIAPATVAAFNAWRLAERTRMRAYMEAHPERYGTDIDDLFPALVPAAAGQWTTEGGWHRIDPVPAPVPYPVAVLRAAVNRVIAEGSPTIEEIRP